MNRERLTILRDHLASLPDERVDMRYVHEKRDCGTVACIAGWACEMAGLRPICTQTAADWLRFTEDQREQLFFAYDADIGLAEITRSDAISAIQSMLDSPDDDALPVWPSREGASA